MCPDCFDFSNQCCQCKADAEKQQLKKELEIRQRSSEKNIDQQKKQRLIGDWQAKLSKIGDNDAIDKENFDSPDSPFKSKPKMPLYMTGSPPQSSNKEPILVSDSPVKVSDDPIMLEYGHDNMPNKRVEMRQSHLNKLSHPTEYWSDCVLEGIDNFDYDRLSNKNKKEIHSLPIIVSQLLSPSKAINDLQKKENFINIFVKSKSPKEITDYFKSGVLNYCISKNSHYSFMNVTNLSSVFREEFLDNEVKNEILFKIY
jgi:hypothetical protein